MPEFAAIAEMAKASCHLKKRPLGEINHPVNKVAEGVHRIGEVFWRYRGWVIVIESRFRILLEIVKRRIGIIKLIQESLPVGLKPLCFIHDLFYS
jgi:hypothetical protein